MKARRWFIIGCYSIFVMAAAHFITNWNGLNIHVSDPQGKELLSLMKDYEIDFFGWMRTMDQTTQGFIITWGAMLIGVGLVNLIVARSRPNMAPPYSIRLVNAIAWLVCLIAAAIYWSWPQILLFGIMFICFFLSLFEGIPIFPPKPDPNKKPSPKVAVIGAGAAGLTTAFALQKKGYKVTVFDNADRIGGKCYTKQDGDFAIDIGAHEMLAGYQDVMRIADEVGAPSHGHQNVLVYDRHKKKYFDVLAANSNAGYSNLAVGWAALRYTWLLLTRYRHISKPGTGLANAPAELKQPIGTWLREMKLEALSEIVLFVMKVQGYGRLDEVAALYFVKFQGFRNWVSNVGHAIGIVQAWPRVFTNGFEDLWQRVANRLDDVRLNQNISKITRHLRDDAEMMEISISFKEQKKKDETFDYLVLACPQDLKTLQALGLDMTEAEKELFDKVEYHTMVTTLCHVEGIPTGVVGTIPLPALMDYTGYIKVYEECDVVIFFTLSPTPNPNLDEIYKNVKAQVAALPHTEIKKPKVLKKFYQKKWDYFPHIGLPEIGGGYFDKLEALQGHKHTFYTGSLHEMETVGNTVANAQTLANIQFPPVK